MAYKQKKKQSSFPGWLVFTLLLASVTILVTPVIFTQPSFLGWNCFDFSDKGSIGDTIGGITAPFVGLLSIILLAWTLYEQVQINREQKKYNDTSRIIAVLSHIQNMDDNLLFLYSTPRSLCEGKGLASFGIFNSNGRSDILFSFEEVLMIEKKTTIILTALSSLLSIIKDSNLEVEDQSSYHSIIRNYLTSLYAFYHAVEKQEIHYLFPQQDGLDWKNEEKQLIFRSHKAILSITKANNYLDNDFRG